MGILNIIRRMALREKLPIREIARRTGMSRNTIKGYLDEGTIEPHFATPERQSKLDPFADKLAGWLKTEGTNARKQRRTQQIGVNLMAFRSFAGVGFLINRLEPHQTPDPLFVHQMISIAQMPCHLTHSVKRGLQKLLVDQPHQIEVHLTLAFRLIVKRRPRDR